MSVQFTTLYFSEETTFQTPDGPVEVKPDVGYEVPLHRADKILAGTPEAASYEGSFSVPDEEVAERLFSKTDTDEGNVPEEDDEEIPDYDILDGNVGEVKEHVGSLDDLEILNDLLEIEQNGDARKTALEAIDSRIEELKEADSEEE